MPEGIIINRHFFLFPLSIFNFSPPSPVVALVTAPRDGERFARCDFASYVLEIRVEDFPFDLG